MKIQFINNALLLGKVLIIADCHIGFEHALNDEGMLIPRFQLESMTSPLIDILEKYKPKKVVINGDLKHDFGRINKQEWKQTLSFLELIKSYADIVLVKGNHDTILAPIVKRQGIEPVESFTIGRTYCVHGHILTEIPKKINRIVIGHEHPAIRLYEGIKSEEYKCFLRGKYQKAELIALPSFNPLIPGSDILSKGFLSPWLASAKGLKPLICTKSGLLRFPSLSSIQRFLYKHS